MTVYPVHSLVAKVRPFVTRGCRGYGAINVTIGTIVGSISVAFTPKRI